MLNEMKLSAKTCVKTFLCIILSQPQNFTSFVLKFPRQTKDSPMLILPHAIENSLVSATQLDLEKASNSMNIQQPCNNLMSV